MKILTIILGVLLLIGGIYCLASPGLTFLKLAPVCGVLMVADGLSSIFVWGDRRKQGISDGWDLFAAIVSLILGIAMFVSLGAALVFEAMITYMVIAWLIIVGVLRIVAAVKFRGIAKELESRIGGSFSGSFGFVLAMGILMVVIGIIGLINPFTVALGIGLMIGMSILAVGISVLSVGLTMK